MNFNDLQLLYIPGKGKVQRVPNRLSKGFLKRSIFTSARRWFNPDKAKRIHGDREKARRVRQIERGIISPEQVLRGSHAA